MFKKLGVAAMAAAAVLAMGACSSSSTSNPSSSPSSAGTQAISNAAACDKFYATVVSFSNRLEAISNQVQAKTISDEQARADAKAILEEEANVAVSSGAIAEPELKVNFEKAAEKFRSLADSPTPWNTKSANGDLLTSGIGDVALTCQQLIDFKKYAPSPTAS